MKRISILGSTGSVGTQTLDVVAMHPDQFIVDGLAAGSNTELLLEQVGRFNPRRVSVSSKQHAEEIRSSLPAGVELFYGNEGLVEIAAGGEAETVVTALVGSVGLQSTLAAIEAGRHIGLANKETLVTAGHLVTELANRKGVKILPVDSEHSAIFQCLNGENRADIASITITASGGSFRDYTRDQLVNVTVEDALRHPNWSMGAKITIDSATMVNKGLEVIEAHWLFNLPYEKINVLLHPESIIHSYVEFCDSSIIAQLGSPDMRVPIQYALTYPNRWPSPASRLSLAEIGRLTFREMDYVRYPLLKLAIECGKAGGTATTAYNAANEVAVARFLRREIPFLRIEEIIEEVLQRHENAGNPDLQQIEQCDAVTREIAAKL
ncbi:MULTISPECIES: 1-deoxy-D-xylulose-5-phosphate reductoisomerase [unclassified Paenibacillus]|uniref:1-deoxy-D-xylulose-5-phosphate reductoisomerase n=1 Tax=unclassified Paenibacillus TaxID=185978 RepID=UPI002405CD20|nr:MULTISPECIES: 1-deoxy-D-xylulose-5-phosphate reductoisomerase [unclassified Paenibacillus]MDF9841347.1 1-deoxy-D-xylulose-5-phosphate reductoisomerase [Paenibacillus sp. PastF-2]MDF9847938.1 1-deoxy-D-xylulose-5-phosphate reductoisomerase [Paenibacillus sp. PastM-2]MDF9854506.1 1-deoxy-D-xylulose-5-phosphate reductoisomerase [Paenibacillus sp. PastF-1]MDH6479885.1 1-deoxy-D-xylulose-5-phosphate reductoisomerase [Paenibacillus sp. PastH-2]MDH6507213.1 1-deoxy-D-xylulose-5-phosphate reductois